MKAPGIIRLMGPSHPHFHSVLDTENGEENGEEDDEEGEEEEEEEEENGEEE